MFGYGHNLARHAPRLLYKAAKTAYGFRYAKKGAKNVLKSLRAPGRKRVATSKGRLLTKIGVPKSKKFPKRFADTDFINEDLGAGGELTKAQVTCRVGRKLSRSKYANKLVKANKEFQIYSTRAINPFMNVTIAPINKLNTEVGGGAYWLHNHLNANSNMVTPCHIWDITAMVNANANVTYSNPFVGFETRFDSNVSATNVFF